jgi:Asp-tRNA(Asn)/Glu-tRNA(Gln) amidotransferase A subunit family amidase
MTFFWSLDKIGPICRDVEDCGIVYSAIARPDPADPSTMGASTNFAYHPNKADDLRIGYIKSAFEADYAAKTQDQASLTELSNQGIDLIPLELPSNLPINILALIISAEAAAAFDDLTRTGTDDQLTRQDKSAAPNEFRADQTIPATAYINANRVRWMLMREMEKRFEKVDIYIVPTFNDDNLLLTNLTGHPCVVIPNGFSEPNSPSSITIVGRHGTEAEILACAKKLQAAQGYHHQHPPAFKERPE